MVDRVRDENNQTKIQSNIDSTNTRQMLPALPRNYFSSSHEHLCAMQEIMSSLQVILVALGFLLFYLNINFTSCLRYIVHVIVFRAGFK
jgi:hypothetical protein